ncbi:MAG: hypothetical protein J5546_03550 [Lachnospiraceae bacterium]|nr:hypothetical protein [Lachnospiraceae bacterium]
MITLLILIVCFSLIGGVLKFAVKLTWGLTKLLIGLVFLPLIIVAILLGGVFIMAVPFLLIAGIIAALAALKKKGA